MPARWIDLMIRINYVLDDAEDHLDDVQRNVFYTHLLGTATRRQHHRTAKPVDHPIPGQSNNWYRDPTGE